MVRSHNLLVFTIFLLSLYPWQSDAQTKWYDPEKSAVNPMQGQAFEGQERESFYHRFPKKTEEAVRGDVWGLSKSTAGESIVFTTDSENITVRYTVTQGFAMPHMPATGVSGVDLYTHDRNGADVWLTGRYDFSDTVTFCFGPIDILDKPNKAQRYTLFLPLYNEVSWMEIGVDESADFRFEPSPVTKPIVAYGTSIAQGACASRPGMAWSNILQRRLGHEVINLGFSGNAMMENEVIDLISEIDAKVYLLDAMPNVCSFKDTLAIRDTVINAVKRLRSKRPQTPILLVDHIGYPQSKAISTTRSKERRTNRMQKAAYEQLISDGVKNLHYLSYDELAMPLDGTVEGSHASDYGMVAYADAYEKKIREILDEPVGDCSTTVPVMQQRDPYIWLDRHAHIIQEGHGKHFRRVLIGDSIMHFWGGADDAPVVNGASVWEAFEGATLNMGCGYDRIENVLWRIYHGQLDGLTADRIILAIGTNNLGGDSDEDIIEGLRYIINAIKGRRPEAEITLMGILPRRDGEDRVRNINKMYKALAKETGIGYSDPGRELLRKGRIDEALFKDGLHPNEAGYELIAPYFN